MVETQRLPYLNSTKRPNGAGTIFISKQKPEVLQASICDVFGKRKTKSFRFSAHVKSSYSRAYLQAQEWLSAQIKARESGQTNFIVSPSMTLKEFLDLWVENRVFKKYNTYRNYKGAINNWIVPKIGRIKICQVTASTVEELYKSLYEANYSAGTLNLVHRVLSCAFVYATKKNFISNNPMLQVERISIEASPTRHIPKQDFEKIYREAMRDPYMHARVEMGMILGLRPGEVYGLKWSDIDYENQTLTISRQIQYEKGKGLVFISPKQGLERTINLSQSQMEILSIHRLSQDLVRPNWNEDENLIFPNTLGKRLDTRRDARRWSRLLNKAGVPYYNLYRMRKTAFSNLIARGVDVATLMSISGHRQTSTVFKSYVFPATESKLRALEVMDEIRPSMG
jgi:integrase